MTMPYRRERAESFIQEELTLILREQVKDPRVQPLTITGVDLTPDRRIARVYVACYEGEDVLQEALEGLERAKGFLRSCLAESLHWRFTPQLDFRVDRSWEYGERIEELLKKLEMERPVEDDNDATT